MEDIKAKVTKHAEKRTKERVGLRKKIADKNAEKALKYGIKHSDTKGKLKRYFTHLYFKNQKRNNIRIYNRKVYIFSDDKLITVFDLPKEFIRTVDNIKKRNENDL